MEQNEVKKPGQTKEDTKNRTPITNIERPVSLMQKGKVEKEYKTIQAGGF